MMTVVMAAMPLSFRAELAAVRRRAGRRSALTVGGRRRGALRSSALLTDSEVHIELYHSFLHVSLVCLQYARAALPGACRS